MHNQQMNQLPHGQPVQHGMMPQQPHTAMDPTMQQQQHMGLSPDHLQQLHDLCQRYHHHLMQFETQDGQVHDGIIDGIDRNGVNMLMPAGDTDRDDETDLRYGGYGGYFPGGGYGHGYGYGFPRRFRRFRRRHFPFHFLRRFFFPYFY
ncbi:hypothetical protein [Halalkalibacter alkaliphilus]|uniref:Uncharacterized protein n=1 Tax=Halalkalibacter alkaliphilus TaxID=2917993 RepID=A0A9X1ZV71_9BACI|nr:hypothetical protein [Halalkalibacter alkaliphilus]MCL7746104.1 hypothetical protein [Halalkalibacter alkaliphilus]